VLTRTATLTCPYCGERITLAVDPAGDRVQDWIIDCEVCCRPIRVTVSLGRKARVQGERAD
jgi:hypothetical protein